MCGSFLNLQAVAEFCAARQLDILVVAAGWKGQFCLEDTAFGGALAERLQPLGFAITWSDAAIAALHLWQHAKPEWPTYLLESAAVRRLNALEYHDDFVFCMKQDVYPDILPLWREDRLVRG